MKNNSNLDNQDDEKIGMHLGASAHKFRFAAELRERMTPAELKLWEHLRKKQLGGYKFRRQHPAGRFVLDFYCHQKKLGVELDGKIHDNQKEYDLARTQTLEEYGLTIIRFKNEEVFNELETVLSTILNTLEQLESK